jgi:hypothetical protein
MKKNTQKKRGGTLENTLQYNLKNINSTNNNQVQVNTLKGLYRTSVNLKFTILKASTNRLVNKFNFTKSMYNKHQLKLILENLKQQYYEKSSDLREEYMKLSKKTQIENYNAEYRKLSTNANTNIRLHNQLQEKQYYINERHTYYQKLLEDNYNLKVEEVKYIYM